MGCADSLSPHTVVSRHQDATLLAFAAKVCGWCDPQPAILSMCLVPGGVPWLTQTFLSMSSLQLG